MSCAVRHQAVSLTAQQQQQQQPTSARRKRRRTTLTTAAGRQVPLFRIVRSFIATCNTDSGKDSSNILAFLYGRQETCLSNRSRECLQHRRSRQLGYDTRNTTTQPVDKNSTPCPNGTPSPFIGMA